MANQSAISPQYLGNFTCIGSDCEDTCCSGWTVSVNKSAFKEGLGKEEDVKEKVF